MSLHIFALVNFSHSVEHVVCPLSICDHRINLGIVLIAAAVVQLKMISSSLSADESLPNSLVEKSSILQKILVYVVLILCSYIDLQSGLFAKTPFDSRSWDMFVPRRSRACNELSTREQVSPSDKMVLWLQKAIVSVMEAGGLNWLVGKVCNFRF